MTGVSSRPEVHLVVPPYAPIAHPSLATGILKASLAEAGISATVRYLNLTHADEIGLARYELYGSWSGLSLLGEWTFARAAFPDAAADGDAYLALALEILQERLGAREARSMLSALSETRDWQRAARDVRDSAERLIQRTAEEIADLRPRIVGCSSTFQQHCASLALLRRIREISPEIVTVLGGGNCDGRMGLANHESFPWLDFVVSGEADLLFPALCRRILAGGPRLSTSEIPTGVYARRTRLPSLSSSLSRAVVNDMDATAIPDVTDYFLQLAGTSSARYVHPAMIIETSRGCWWGEIAHCTFCGLNGNGMEFRSKSADRVIREIQVLSATYGVKRFAAVDNILDMKYFDSVIPRLAEAGGYELFYETKANLRREQVRHLAEAGVRTIQPGIESLHDEPLAKMAKGNNAATNVQLLRYTREAGIDVKWFILSGLPDDEDRWYDEMADLAPLLSHLEPPQSLNEVEWHRFSPYYERAGDFGLELRPARAYGHVYPLPERALADLAYAFETAGAPPQRSRPGWQRLRDAVRAWKAEWAGPTPPRLTFTETDRGLVVLDTRACAAAPRRVLTGLSAEILRACDVARAEPSLLQIARERLGPGVSPEDVKDEIARLRDGKLLIHASGRLVTLATQEPIEEIRAGLAYGFVDVAAYLTDRRKEREARAALAPGDVLVRDLFS